MSDTRSTPKLTPAGVQSGMDITQALLAGQTVLTPDARSAELVRERYTKHMQLSELRAWASPNVLPWRVWAANFYSLVIPDGPVLLSNEQSLLIWEQIVSAEDDISIEQVSQFTRLAAEAWATQHLWQINVARLNKTNSSFEVGLFMKWQRAYVARCRELEVVDCYQSLLRLESAFADQGGEDFAREYLVADRLLVGYAKVPPLLEALSPQCWLCEQQSKGANDSTPLNRAGLLRFDDEIDEIAAAIQWAVSQQLISPEKTVAIALSNPSMLGDSVALGIQRYCANAVAAGVIDPNKALEVQTARQIITTKQRPLNQDKLIQSALRVLRFSGPLACDELSALLLDPYLGDWQAERAGRATLDRDLRADIRELRLSEKFVLTQMRREEYGLQELADTLQAVSELRNNAPHRQSIIAWHEHFESQLALFSWPKQTFILAAEQAAFDAWRQVLDAFVSLSAYAGQCTRNHALHRLTSIIQHRSFDHRKPYQAIRVIGFDEIAHYGPQAVAWCGLGQYQWPPVTRVNPLLPHRAQHEAGVPGCDIAQETELARRDLITAVESVAENRFSFCARLGDIDNAPVVLFSAAEAIDTAALAASNSAQHSFDFALDSKEDNRGLALDPSARLRNAVRFFADQAACPFKAYAAHRLGSDAIEEPALGLDARRRGELVHLAVGKLWEALLTHETLMAMSEGSIDELIESVVGKSIAEYRQTTRQLSHYWTLEAARLAKLLHEWLEVERKRQSFEVMGIEESFDANIAEFQFKIRLDRIDKLEDGALALIDFKTSTDTKSSWAPPRIDQPQLPIYAVNFENDDVEAVAYAQIKSGQCDFKDLPPKALSKGLRDEAWQAQMRAWRHDLNDTAEQIAGGAAQVDPKRTATCRYCEHRLLCRINDKRTDLPEDNESNGLVLNDGSEDE